MLQLAELALLVVLDVLVLGEDPVDHDGQDAHPLVLQERHPILTSMYMDIQNILRRHLKLGHLSIKQNLLLEIESVY